MNSAEEKLAEIGKQYKIPIILGIAGTIFIISSVLFLFKRNKPTTVTFSQKESSPSASFVVIDIQGAVEHPGVYELGSGSRMGDLIVMAGGLSSSADRDWIAKNVNQAARLIDGTKVYLPSVSDPITESVQSGNGVVGISYDSVVNINIASQSELEDLPSIGPVTAKKIIDGRPYQSIEELKTKKIVGRSTFEKIKDLIAVY